MTLESYATAQDVLSDVRDITVLGRVGDNFVYGIRPSLKAQKRFYEESESCGIDLPPICSSWEFDERKGIIGSDFYLCLRLDKSALRPRGFWIPGLREARLLDAQEKLTNGVYRDYGALVFGDTYPEKYLAGWFVADARERELDLPLIIPFRAMDYAIAKGKSKFNGWRYKLVLVNHLKGVLSGKDAVKEISELNARGGFSGVQRLCRRESGGWDDFGYGMGGLSGSFPNGRVDWICGEAPREEIVAAHESWLRRKYGAGMKREREDFERSLS